MALRIQYRKKIHGVIMKSGYIYSFKYIPWQHDPNPIIIFMNSFSGTHPNTGRQWRFIQALNFTYVPRSSRKHFANEWKTVFERTNGNVRFTWNIVKRWYPYLQHSIRRYFYSPGYYISQLQEIPFDNMEAAIVSTWSKDFSKKVKLSMLQKFRSAMSGRKEIKKKARDNLNKYRV